jgi:hypothetical protein
MRKIKPDVKAKDRTTMESEISSKWKMNGRRCSLPLKVTSANVQKNQKKTGGETPPKAHAEHSVNKICLKTLTYFSGINWGIGTNPLLKGFWIVVAKNSNFSRRQLYLFTFNI